MQGLTHGSDLRLAPTIRPIATQYAGSARRAITQIAEAGFTAIQLDAAMPGLRPRELDTSARRDLLATLARTGLSLAGIDLFIPPDHYSDPAHLDRAAEANHAALSLAAELGRVPLTLNLPIDQADASLVNATTAAADDCGSPLVICSTQNTEQLLSWIKQHGDGVASAAIDPATLLMARSDPAQAAQQLTGSLGVARLCDATRGQSDSRSPVGQGDLDLMAYRVSIDLAQSRHGPVVLDLRALSSPLAAASLARVAWKKAII